MYYKEELVLYICHAFNNNVVVIVVVFINVEEM